MCIISFIFFFCSKKYIFFETLSNLHQLKLICHFSLTITILDYGEWEVQQTQCIWLLRIFHTLKDLTLTLLKPLNYFAPQVALEQVDALIGNVNQEQTIPSILLSRYDLKVMQLSLT